MTVYQTALSGNAPAIPAGVDEALRLAGIGWAVFPLHPATGTPYANADIAAALAIPEPPKGKGGLHLATMDEAAIRALWRDRPGAHIGIATGAPSGLYVLDVDRKDGKDGFAALAKAGVTIPDTFRIDTPSGGRHYLFAVARDGLRRFATDSGVIAEGVDRRGDGGYIRWYGDAFGCSGNVPMVAPPEWMLSGSATGSSPGQRRPLGDPALAAPSLTLANEALNCIDPNDLSYSEWIATSAAYRQSVTSHDPGGYFSKAYWDLWCAKYDGNDRAENDQTWRSFDNGTDAGWEALLKRAGPNMRAKALGLPPPPATSIAPVNRQVVLAPVDMPMDVTTGAPSVLTIVQSLSEWKAPFAFDQFAGSAVLTGPLQRAVNQSYPRPVEDADATAIAILFNAMGRKPATATIHEAINYYARQRSFNPVTDYLNPLQWDGRPRLDNWLATYCGATQSEWTVLIGPKVLIAMVARAMQPGCKVDTVLILEGLQGIGKSTAFEILAGRNHFTDDLDGMQEKDDKMALMGRWVVEIGELSAMRRILLKNSPCGRANLLIHWTRHSGDR